MNKLFVALFQLLLPLISITGAYAVPPPVQSAPPPPADTRGNVIYSNPYYPYGAFYYPPNQDIDPDETRFNNIYEENRRTIGQ